MHPIWTYDTIILCGEPKLRKLTYLLPKQIDQGLSLTLWSIFFLNRTGYKLPHISCLIWKLLLKRDFSVQFIFLFGTPKTLSRHIDYTSHDKCFNKNNYFNVCFIWCVHEQSRQEHIKGVSERDSLLIFASTGSTHNSLHNNALQSSALCPYLSAHVWRFYNSPNC